jgi:hypothetical protein
VRPDGFSRNAVDEMQAGIYDIADAKVTIQITITVASLLYVGLVKVLILSSRSTQILYLNGGRPARLFTADLMELSERGI